MWRVAIVRSKMGMTVVEVDKSGMLEAERDTIE